MELINNRYKIEQSLGENPWASNYVVTELLKTRKKRVLSILNPDSVSKKLIEFLKDNFFVLSTMHHPNMVGLHSFGPIHNIDNKDFSIDQFVITREYCQDYVTLNVAKELMEDEIISIFIQISWALAYIHFRGFTYQLLTPENILYNKHQDNTSIKLRDLVYIEQLKAINNDYRINQSQGSEEYENYQKAISRDIYSLGVMFVYLYLKSLDKHYILEEMSEDINSIIKTYLPQHIQPIVSDILSGKFNSVNEIIGSINHSLNHEYPLFLKEYHEKLNFKIKLIGRESELKSLLDSNSISRERNRIEITTVNGLEGIGKSRLVREFAYRLKFSNKKVIYSSIDRDKSIAYGPVITIIKQIMNVAAEQLIEKYGAEIVKLVPEIGFNHTNKPQQPINKAKEKLRLNDRISNFIMEWARESRPTIIIDNFHYIDSESLEFFEQILTDKENYPIHFVFVCRDKELVNNKDAESFINNVRNKATNLSLLRLDVRETARMIQQMLGSKHTPMIFGARCFKETEGNPRFNEELICSLFTKKIIYIGKDGEWQTAFEDYDNIPMPSTVDDAVLTQLSTFDDLSRRVIETISVFNQPVSQEILIRMLNIDRELLASIINKLVVLRIVQERVSDWGYTYIIDNNNIKSGVLYNISENRLTELHRLAAYSLEANDYRYNLDNNDELIYHLSKSGNISKAAQYSLESAKKIEERMLYPQALSYYERTYALMQRISDYKGHIEVLLKIGNMLEILGKNDEAILKYKEAYNEAKAVMCATSEVNALIFSGEIYFKRLEFERAEEHFFKALQVSQEENYTEGVLGCGFNIARIYVNDSRYELAKETVNKYLPLSNENKNNLYTGELNNLLGIISVNTGKYEEALEYYRASIRTFEEGGYFGQTIKPLNNIGVLYGDVYQNQERAMECFHKMLAVANKYNISYGIATASNNLGEYYYEEGDYVNALKYYFSALKISEENDNQRLCFVLYVNIGNAYLSLEEYGKAYEYLLKMRNPIFKVGDEVIKSESYYTFLGKFYFKMGDYLKSREYTKKTLDMLVFSDVRIKIYNEVLSIQLDILEGKDIDIEQILSSIKNLNNKLDHYRMLCNIGDLYIHLNRQDKLRELYNELLKIDRIPTSSIGIRLRYFEAYLSEELQCELKKVLDLAIKTTNLDYQFRCYRDLGILAYGANDIYQAANHFINAFDILQRITANIPNEFNVKFIHAFNRYRVKNYLVNLIGIYDSLENRETAITSELDVNQKPQYSNIREFFDDDRILRILRDEKTLKYAVKNRTRLLPDDLVRPGYLVNGFEGEPVKDIELILKYLVEISFADRAFVLVKGSSDESELLCSVLVDNKQEIIDNLSSEIATITEPYFQNSFFIVSQNDKLLNHTIRAKIIVPIYRNRTNPSIENERRKDNIRDMSPMGYVYLDTSKIFNNFTENIFSTAKTMSKIISVLMENYYLKISSSIDKLTGACTRKHFEIALKEELKISKLSSIPLSLIMFDIDHFKLVNDNYGHQKGDEILRELCKIVLNSIRTSDTLGRYGGEEFIIILPGVNQDEACSIAEKIRAKVAQSYLLGGDNPVTISLGIATYPRHGDLEEELISKADQALYQAKETGRNKYCIWDKTIGKNVKRADKLAGLVTGNSVQDQRHVLALTEIMELIKFNLSYEEKVYKILGRVVEITEAQKGIYIECIDGRTTKVFGRERIKDEWIQPESYNVSIVNRVILSKSGEYLIDWDETTSIDTVTGKPLWQSIMVLPVIKKEEVIGVIYLSVSIKEKEFDFDSFNYVSILSNAVASVLKEY